MADFRFLFNPSIKISFAAILFLGGPLLAQEEPPRISPNEKEISVHTELLIREIPQGPNKLPLIAVGSPSGNHFLYNPNMLVVRGFWKGRFGWETSAGEFKPNQEELQSFSLNRKPWSYGERKRRPLIHKWLGYEIRDQTVWMRYRLDDPPSGMHWQVEESLEIASDTIQRIHFKIKPSAQSKRYLNYWLTQVDFRRVTTNGQPNQRNKLKNLFPNQTDFSITFVRKKQTPTTPHGYLVEVQAIPQPPKPFRFEPTDLDFAPNGDVYVSTRNGIIWRRHQGQWSLFAEGLHEANGIRISPKGDGVYVMQKPELTLLTDLNNDGRADRYQTIEDRFRFSGHYHEFAYGPRINQRGDMFFTTGLASHGQHLAEPKQKKNQMSSALGYRGWVLKHDLSSGRFIPFACGLRSPAGIGINAKDELFVTDNQGDWVASSYLTHVEEGDFLGHPASLWDRPSYGLTPQTLTYKTVGNIPKTVPPLNREAFTKERKLPSVWLAHNDLTNSPGHPSFAPEKGFGPFGGQAFIADISHRSVIRVALEKVAGAYQGAAFPFLRPLSSASYSTAFDPAGNLWVGSVGRGWTAGAPALEMIKYDPLKEPFEMHRIELTPTGFKIHFTQALSPDPISPASISVSSFFYNYWEVYGSEPIDEQAIAIDELNLSQDRKTLTLTLPLQAERIYQIQLPVLETDAGLTLENNYGYYTLNRLAP